MTKLLFKAELELFFFLNFIIDLFRKFSAKETVPAVMMQCDVASFAFEQLSLGLGISYNFSR